MTSLSFPGREEAVKIPGDNLLGSPGGGRQPEREQGMQLMPVLCGDQIRTVGEMQELVQSLFLLLGGKSQGSAHILECILSPWVREEQKEEPQRAAVDQAAQGKPAVDQETWVGNSVPPLTNPGWSPKFPVPQNLQL